MKINTEITLTLTLEEARELVKILGNTPNGTMDTYEHVRDIWLALVQQTQLPKEGW